MRGRGMAAVLGTGIAGLSLVPVASAHHGDPYCEYGARTLPDNVTVEFYRFGEGCDGPRVTVDLENGKQVVLFHSSRESGAGVQPRKAQAAEAEPAKKKKRCKKNRRGRKCAR